MMKYSDIHKNSDIKENNELSLFKKKSFLFNNKFYYLVLGSDFFILDLKI